MRSLESSENLSYIEDARCLKVNGPLLKIHSLGSFNICTSYFRE